MDEKQKKMVLDWMRKVHSLEYGHRFESMRWSNLNLLLGIPSLIFAVIIGTIATLPKDNFLFTYINKDIITSIGGIAVAILTGLQTFLKPNELSEKHRNTSTTYEKLRHRIEYFIEFDCKNGDIDSKLSEIRKDWDNIDSLNISNEKFIAAKAKVKSLNKYPEELGFLDDIKPRTKKRCFLFK